MKSTWAGMLFLGVIIAAGAFSFLALQGDSQDPEADIVVSADKEIGKIGLDYGANENDLLQHFVSDGVPKQLHRDVNSKYIRIWLNDPDYRGFSTIPYSRGAYDFTNLDMLVNSVLESDAIPFLVVAYAPDELSVNRRGDSANPPLNDGLFAEYVAAVVKHYKDLCGNSKMGECNFEEWYWEIWNEPFDKGWFESSPSRFSEMFNIVYAKVKLAAPEAKVGGFTLPFYPDKFGEHGFSGELNRFLSEVSSIDFVSIHVYGSQIDKSRAGSQVDADNPELNYDQIMADAEALYYESPRMLRSVVDSYPRHSGTEIILSELSSEPGDEYMPRLDEPFTKAWYASALIWIIRSGVVSKEMFYSGTSWPDGGFGLWGKNRDGTYNLWDICFMKQDFAGHNSRDAVVVESIAKNKHVNAMAVKKDTGEGKSMLVLTIVNELDSSRELAVDVEGLDIQYVSDGGNNLLFDELDSFIIRLDPYEVKFVEIA
jgi:hypothetical protein